MAFAQASVHTDDVLRGLECPICQEYFREPRILPCGHTLCLQPCLEMISAAKPRFRCAECRREHDVPAGGVRDFPKNVAISRQIIPEGRKTDGRAVSTLKSCPICSEEEDLLKCGHCKMFVCYVCVTKHIPKFKEKIEKQARDIRDEAGSSSKLCLSTQEATRVKLTQDADAAVAEIQAAARRAVQMVEERAEELESQVQLIHKLQLDDLSEESGKILDVWRTVTGICDTTLVDIHDENVPFSPAKLSKIDDKLESAHKRATDLKLTSLAPEEMIKVKVDFTLIKDAVKNFNTLDTVSKTSIVPDTDICQTLNSLTISSTEISAKSVVSKTDLIDKDISNIVMQFGTSGANLGQLSRPLSVAVNENNGDILVVDAGNHRIQKFDSTGRLSLCFGSKGSGSNQFSSPFSLVITKQNQLVISDELNHNIKFYNSHGSLQRAIGSYGSAPGQFSHPCGLALDQSGNIHVCDGSNNRIQVLSPTGKYIRQYKARECTYPTYISMAANGLIVVSDGRNCALLSQEGHPLSTWQVSNNVSGLHVDAQDQVIVSHAGFHTICVYNLGGNLLKSFDLSRTNQFHEPRGITMDKHGHLYVACRRSIFKF